MANFLKRYNTKLRFPPATACSDFSNCKIPRVCPWKRRRGFTSWTVAHARNFTSGRSFGVLFKQHLPENSELTSNFAKHLVDEYHQYGTFEEICKPLLFCEKGRYMNTLEEYEIWQVYKLGSNNIFNDKLCFTTNALYDTAMHAEVYRELNGHRLDI